MRRALCAMANGVAMVCVAVALLCGAAACGQHETPDARRPNVVLIGIEGLRRDEVKHLGAAKASASYADHLARKGAAFTHAYAASSWALPSWASVLTGHLPSDHQAVEPAATLRAGLPTLAAEMKAAGYRTAAYVSNPYLTRQQGFGAGFDEYNHLASSQAKEMAAKAVEWLDKDDKQPFFLVMDLADAELPYEPRDEQSAELRALDLPVHVFTSIDAAGVVENWPGDEAKASLAAARRLYRAEIDQADRAVMLIHQHLDLRRQLENTVFIVFSPHGEEFMDHGLMANGYTLNEEVIGVPLVISQPGRIVPETRIDTPVSLLDLRPTILDMAGLAVPAEAQGVSLKSALEGSAEPDDRYLIAETSLGGPDRFAVINGRTKAMFAPDYNLTGHAFGPRLYQLDHDKAETRSLLPQASGKLAPFEAALAAHDCYKKQRWLRVEFGATPDTKLYSGAVSTGGRFRATTKATLRLRLTNGVPTVDDFILVRTPQALLFAADGASGGNGFEFAIEPPDSPVNTILRVDGRFDPRRVDTGGPVAAEGAVDLASIVGASKPAVPGAYAISVRYEWTSANSGQHPDVYDALRPTPALLGRLAELVQARDRSLWNLVIQQINKAGAP